MDVAEALDFMRQRAFGDDISDTVTYNGSEINCHIEWGAGAARGNASRAVIEVSREDVASPAYRDEVVIDGVSWRGYRDVRTGEGWTGDALSWRIPLIRDERPGLNR